MFAELLKQELGEGCALTAVVLAVTVPLAWRKGFAAACWGLGGIFAVAALAAAATITTVMAG